MYKYISFFCEDDCLNDQLIKFLSWEWSTCTNFIIEALQSNILLGNFFKASVNKLKNLQFAIKCGFNIPETIISEKNQIVTTCRYTELITKSISETMTIADGSSYLDLKTTIVNRSNDFFSFTLLRKN